MNPYFKQTKETRLPFLTLNLPLFSLSLSRQVQTLNNNKKSASPPSYSHSPLSSGPNFKQQ